MLFIQLKLIYEYICWMTFLKLLHSELLKRPTSKNIGSTVHLCITFVIKSLMNSNIRNCINLSDNSFRFLILEQTNELICSSYLQNCFDSTFRWKRFVSSIIPNGGRRSLAAQCRQLLLKEREREKEKKETCSFETRRLTWSNKLLWTDITVYYFRQNLRTSF